VVRIAGASRHPNSLANLEKRPAPPIGNRLSHGFTSERLVRDVNAGVGEIMDALAEAAPVREGDGSLPAADVVAVEVAARALKRYRSVSGWCDLHGRSMTRAKSGPRRGTRSRPRISFTECSTTSAASMACSKLGLNTARTAGACDLALHWQEDGGE
jgi:hypothetical protein